MVSLSTAGTRKRKQPATEEKKVRLRDDAEVRARHGESSTGLALHARRPHMGGQAVRYPEGDAKWVKEGIEQIKL